MNENNNISPIDDNLIFHAFENIFTLPNKRLITLGIVTKKNDVNIQNQSFYIFVYNRNNNDNNNLNKMKIRKLNDNFTYNRNINKKMFLIDGPILISHIEQTSKLNRIQIYNLNNTINFSFPNIINLPNGIELVDVIYERNIKSNNIYSETDGNICLLHLINTIDSNDSTLNNDNIEHIWISVDIMEIISSSIVSINCESCSSNSIIYNKIIDVNTNIIKKKSSSPFILDTNINGLCFINLEYDHNYYYSQKKLPFIITTSTNSAINCYKGDALVRKTELPIEFTSSKENIKIVKSIMKGCDIIILSHIDIKTSVVIYSLPDLALLQEIKGIGLFAIGTFLHPLYEHMLCIPSNKLIETETNKLNCWNSISRIYNYTDNPINNNNNNFENYLSLSCPLFVKYTINNNVKDWIFLQLNNKTTLGHLYDYNITISKWTDSGVSEKYFDINNRIIIDKKRKKKRKNKDIENDNDDIIDNIHVNDDINKSNKLLKSTSNNQLELMNSQFNNTNPIKQGLDNIDNQRQESVLGALTIRLLRIQEKSKLLIKALNIKRISLSGLRYSLLYIADNNNIVKNKSVISNNNMYQSTIKLSDVSNFLTPLYNNKEAVGANSINLLNNHSNAPMLMSSTSAPVISSLQTEVSPSEITNLKLLDAIYFAIPMSWSIVVFVKVLNTTSLPVFDLNVNLYIINSGFQSNNNSKIRNNYSGGSIDSSTYSANVSILLPNNEAWVSCKLDLPSNIFIKGGQTVPISISLQWSQFLCKRNSSNRYNNVNDKKICQILMSDISRSCFEIKNKLLPSKNKTLICSIILLTSNEMLSNHYQIDTNTNNNTNNNNNKYLKYKENCNLFSPYMIAKSCLIETNSSNISESNIYNQLQDWMKKSMINGTKDIEIYSYIPHVSLIVCSNDSNKNYNKDKIVNELNQINSSSNNNSPFNIKSIPFDNLLSFISLTHSTSNLDGSKVFINSNNNNDNNRFHEIDAKLIINASGNENNIKSILSSSLICFQSLLPNSLNIKFSANNNNNYEIIRLLSIYLLEEMKILATAWRLQVIRNRNRNTVKKDNKIYIKMGNYLKCNAIIGKILLSKQEKTDLIVSNAMSIFYNL